MIKKSENELNEIYPGYGHFYYAELNDEYRIFCRSVLEIVYVNYEPDNIYELS